jgi:hypothetical protein
VRALDIQSNCNFEHKNTSEIMFRKQPFQKHFGRFFAANDESTDEYQLMTKKKILRTLLSNPEYESFHDNNFLLH